MENKNKWMAEWTNKKIPWLIAFNFKCVLLIHKLRRRQVEVVLPGQLLLYKSSRTARNILICLRRPHRRNCRWSVDSPFSRWFYMLLLLLAAGVSVRRVVTEKCRDKFSEAACVATFGKTVWIIEYSWVSTSGACEMWMIVAMYYLRNLCAPDENQMWICEIPMQFDVGPCHSWVSRRIFFPLLDQSWDISSAKTK